MPESSSPPSVPGSLRRTLQSARDGVFAPVDHFREIMASEKSDIQVTGTLAATCLAACLFPFGFALVGILSVADNALNGRREPRVRQGVAQGPTAPLGGSIPPEGPQETPAPLDGFPGEADAAAAKA